MKRAVITGATGQIGTALTKILLQKGIKVIAICRPESERINNLPNDSELQVITCGFSEFDTLEVLVDAPCDAFFHLGWADTFEASSRNDLIPQIQNIKYSVMAVRLASKMQCSVFVGAGSQAEYGRSPYPLTPETPCHPETGYGMAKLCCGQMTRIECTRLGLRHIWPRMLSIYGPEDRAVAMVPSLITNCLKGVPPKMTKGEQLWDYLYSEDAAMALYLMALKGRDGAVYPLGSGSARPLREYVETICSIVNPDIRPSFGEVPYSATQIMYLCADTCVLKADTGWEPTTAFDAGIRQTLAWMQSV